MRARRRKQDSKPATTTDLALKGLMTTIEELGYRRYQPLYGVDSDQVQHLGRPSRPVDERWQHIAANLPSHGSALDIGSQYGWFTFQLAQRGLTTLGVERFEADFRISQWLTVYNQVTNAAFIQTDVTTETVETLPAVDVVLCLSIFHHWAVKNGEDYAIQILHALADRTRDRMFFETGQFDEGDRSWRKQLAFMGGSPLDWMVDQLRRFGFAQVIHLADTRPARSEERTPRHLVMATRM